MHLELTDVFKQAAAKYLSRVDADPKRSNQHEIGGLKKAGLDIHGHGERYPARLVYIDDRAEASPVMGDDTVTWYDARFNDDNRSAEYRLYYRANAVTAHLSAGDFMLVAVCEDDSLLLVFCPAESPAQAQLCAIFNVVEPTTRLQPVAVQQRRLLLPVRLFLEDCGLLNATTMTLADTIDEEADAALLSQAYPAGFPDTRSFSDFARERCDIDGIDSPDAALVEWMETEERLFRLLERELVEEQLARGFGVGGIDVDAFMSFSLSVQNRRKSRAGHSFENHVAHLLTLHELEFERGSPSRTTENRAQPDFLLPGFAQYHDKEFSDHRLRLLAAKTTCKDRWRQVLSEGKRVRRKHLLTLQPAFSENQLAEMASHNLQLVLPDTITTEYPGIDPSPIQSVSELLAELKTNQRNQAEEMVWPSEG